MALTQVKSDGIATGAVTADQIAANAVTVDDIADGSISTAKLADANVTTAKIADDAVTADKLANTAVTAGSYTLASVTVDAQGRITAASSGTAGDADKIEEGNTSAEVVDTGSDGHFKVVTEGTEALRINSSQQIGIGTTSPSSLLHLEGSAPKISLKHTATGSQGALRWIDSAGTVKSQIASYTNVADSGNIEFCTNGTGTDMVLDSSGRLGIGTTSPGVPLEVQANSGAEAIYLRGNSSNISQMHFRNNAGSATQFRISSESGGTELNSIGSAYMSFVTNSSERMRLDGNGYLDLKKNTSSNESRFYFNGTGTRIVYNDSSGNLTFYTNSAARAYFGYTGGFYPSTDNAMPLGGGGNRWTAVYAANGTIQTSDLREKTDIATSSLGTDFIKQLRPVSYKFKVGENIVTTDEETETEVITPRAGERTHWGFVAQEVKEVVDDAGVDFGGWILTDKDDPDSTQGLRYDQFIAPLTKALQEAIAKIETLETANASQAATIAALDARLTALEA